MSKSLTEQVIKAAKSGGIVQFSIKKEDALLYLPQLQQALKKADKAILFIDKIETASKNSNEEHVKSLEAAYKTNAPVEVLKLSSDTYEIKISFPKSHI